MINQNMYALGANRSCIRELFEYGRQRASIVGAGNVFDYSLGNPSIPAPAGVNEAIKAVLDEMPSLAIHGYTSAIGDADTRKAIADDFAAIPIEKTPKVKVAVIGELYLKYSAPGNNHLEEFLAEQDCEVYVPSILGFGIYKTTGALEDLRLYGGKPIKKLILEIAMKYMFWMEDILISAIKSNM